MLCLCHLENRRKSPYTVRPAQLALFEFLLILALGLAKDAAASSSPSGTSTVPIASLSPTSLTFASQAVGSTSAAKTVTLTNTGKAALSISSVALTGASPGDFAQTDSCGSSLAAGAKCAITVTYTPTVLIAETAGLTVADNASNSPQTTTVTGTGILPVTLSVTSLSFGNVGEKSPSTAQSIKLTNNQAEALAISNITLSNPDYTETNTCNGSVAAKGNCTITVRLTPGALGTDNGTLSVTDNASNSPQVVSLTGTGVAPIASLSPTSLAFGYEPVGTTSSSYVVSLNNIGNAALSISRIALTGADPGDYAQANSCGSSLAAGAKCTITLTFKPAAIGTRTAAVTFADNASGSPQAVSLTGTGAAPVASLSPARLIFGNEPVDTTSSPCVVTLTNTGNATLDITSAAIIGANATDFIENDSCGSSVAAGGSCTFAILFAPSAAGTRTGSLTLTDNAIASSQPIPLSGTGTHDVILSWIPSTTPGVAGYYVYRGTASQGESVTPLNTTPINGTTYADPNVTPGATYYYVVTAVAADDVTESADSKEVSATVP